MAVKIILSTAGIKNSEEICDTANNGEMAVELIKSYVE